MHDISRTCRSQLVGERIDAVDQVGCLANKLAPTDLLHGEPHA